MTPTNLTLARALIATLTADQPLTPEQLAGYAKAGFIITRCECDVFYVPLHVQPYLLNTCLNCGHGIKRLLADGTWQTQAERNQENLARLEE